MQNPVISIGIIFKNEIRSLERCVKALQPLRDAVPSELVMADTGSDDGSREIAEQYADILIDFPWINDFSAARNAVIDRCTGRWLLVVDSDEYLDEDITQLVNFLERDGKRPPKEKAPNYGCITVRNYSTYEMDGPYSDFMTIRMIRRSSGVRYAGAIHERLEIQERDMLVEPLMKVILHHDGYVGLGTEAGRKKRERNVRLLRQKLEEEPDDLITLMQFLESGITESDYEDKLKYTVDLVLKKHTGWSRFGPPIMRDAISAAAGRELPEADEWIKKAEELFPQSAYTLVDINYIACMRSLTGTKIDYKDVISRGERYLKALQGVRDGTLDPLARMHGILSYESVQSEQNVRYNLANACVQENEFERGLAAMEGIDYGSMDVKRAVSSVQVLRNLHFASYLDTANALMAMWDGIAEPRPSAEKAEARRKGVVEACDALFSDHFRTEEQKDAGYCRPSYTLLLPLKEQCDVGKAAAIMRSTDPVEMHQLLCDMEDWMRTPRGALLHTMEYGMPFPLPEHPMNLEEMDNLAVGLTKEDRYIPVAVRTAEQADPENWQGFMWAHELVLAAVQAWSWEHQEEKGPEEQRENEDQGMALARSFAKLEKDYLFRSYTPEALREDRLFALSPVHRFGWYCVRAFEALDGGDLLTCVRQLRAGLAGYEGMGKMVEFLLSCVEEMERASRIAAAPPELLELAKQVQSMIMRIGPDDPAVDELKKSPAYQQVAWIIEKPATAFGVDMQ